MVARTKTEMAVPTAEQLTKASLMLTELAKRPAPNALDVIWQTVGNDILAARAAGHSWMDIADALATAGIVVSADVLGKSMPDKPKGKKRPKAKTSNRD